MVTFSTVTMNNGNDENDSSELTSLTDKNPRTVHSMTLEEVISDDG